MRRPSLVVLLAVAAVPRLAGAQLQVVSTSPAPSAAAPLASVVSIEFDRALGGAVNDCP
jgi:hypothetical protein